MPSGSIYHDIEIDLYEMSYPVVKAQQADVGSRYLRCYLKNHRDPYVLPQTAEVTLEGLRGDGAEGVGYIIGGIIESHSPAIVVFEITQAITRAGTATCKIVISDNGTILSSVIIYIDIQEKYHLSESTEEWIDFMPVEEFNRRMNNMRTSVLEVNNRMNNIMNEIPTASPSVRGVVKVGDKLSITADGILSADIFANPEGSTERKLSKIQIGNDIFEIDGGGGSSSIKVNPAIAPSTSGNNNILEAIEYSERDYFVPQVIDSDTIDGVNYATKYGLKSSVSGSSDLETYRLTYTKPNATIPSGTSYLPLENLLIDGNYYIVPTAGIEANPEAEATDTLNKLMVNGVTFAVEGGGGGGTTVIPNPTGTPTDELDTIQIDNIIYEIAGSGGGGGGSGSPSSEIYPIEAGDGTLSRAFDLNLSKTPKKISISWYDDSDSWYLHHEFIWGETWASWIAKPYGVGQGGVVGIAAIAYDGNSFTLTGGTAAQACNNVSGNGYVLIDYGTGGSGGSGSGTSQIIDVSSFTKIYDNTKPYGNYGAKISENLDITNEIVIALRMNNGWNASGASYYDSENQTGAYGGYEFGKALTIDYVRFYIGRFVNQNQALYVTAQYLNSNSEWIDVEDMAIDPSISYPISYFDVSYKDFGKIYGVRWIHKKEPIKTNGNNTIFWGMLLFEYKKGDGGSSSSYSMEEQEVGTWIDGDTLYQKTLIANNIYIGTNDTASQFDHDIPDLKMGIVTEAYYDFDNSGSSWTTAIGSVSGYQDRWLVGPNSIYVSGEYWNAQESRYWMVTMRYTKCHNYNNKYIPYTNPTNIVCEAHKDNFNAQSLSWGSGSNPAILSDNVSLYSEDNTAIYVPTKTDGKMLYIDLGETDKPITAYLIFKGIDCTGYNRVVACMKTRANYQGIAAYGSNPITFSSWNDAYSTGVSCNNDFVVIAVKFTGSSIYMNVNNSYTGYILSRTNFGRYFTIGRTDIDPNTTNAEPSDFAIKYLAMVYESESDNAIRANVGNLMNEFNISNE